MDQIFDWCVSFLYWLSDLFGMTYKEINVWIFVIIWPLIILVQGLYIIRIKKQLRKYEEPKS
ncbi:hypothetical protein E1898_09960 [Algoriphagus formosus]|uniref:Uncharacterized protein n=1 Tax=Algoriphagus formosus TaxID=2007308 RepID=A0A4R5V0H9_9BACT|nr:hypothetical protein E1898_09960 [Algoriphagus aquimaris]